METTRANRLNHLSWAIESRAKNQRASLDLLRLFETYESYWTGRELSRCAQDLTSVAFSLWRAAFLADKTGKRSAVFDSAKEFLGRVIEDNAISYVQDKNSREWTFNYYTKAARHTLEALHAYQPMCVPIYVPKTRTAVARWDYCQELLEQAIEGFGRLLRDRQAQEEKVTARQTRKAQKKTNREVVRRISKRP